MSIQELQVGWGDALGNVQRQLDSMRPEQLGEILSKANAMRVSTDEADRLSGQLLYHQVLAALAKE